MHWMDDNSAFTFSAVHVVRPSCPSYSIVRGVWHEKKKGRASSSATSRDRISPQANVRKVAEVSSLHQSYHKLWTWCKLAVSLAIKKQMVQNYHRAGAGRNPRQPQPSAQSLFMRPWQSAKLARFLCILPAYGAGDPVTINHPQHNKMKQPVSLGAPQHPGLTGTPGQHTWLFGSLLIKAVQTNDRTGGNVIVIHTPEPFAVLSQAEICLSAALLPARGQKPEEYGVCCWVGQAAKRSKAKSLSWQAVHIFESSLMRIQTWHLETHCSQFYFFS